MNKLISLQDTIAQVKSEIRTTEDGVGYFTLRALGRICDLSSSTLSTHFSDRISTSKLASTLVEHGFDPITFSSSGVPDKAASLIIMYYAFDAGKNCTEFALQAVKAICAMGIRQWCREVTGWSSSERIAKSVDTKTAESMFSKMMDMENKMNKILVFAEQQVATLTAQVEQQKQVVAEKQETIDNMVEKENVREAKFLLYPGLKEATDFALEWDDEVDEEIFFTLRQFCEVNGIQLTRGQKIQVGKLATDFCRVAVMRKLPKNMVGHTLYSSRFEPIVKLAIMEVLGLTL